MTPYLKDFPKRNLRRFNSGYYSTFNWLEYSVSLDEVFCFACRHFATSSVRKGETAGKRTFIEVGLNKWRDIKQICCKHENSERHKSAMTLWLNFKRIQNNEMNSIDSSISANRQKEILENREHIKILLSATSFLGRQGLSFRGHEESIESDNKGNFIECVETLAKASQPELKLKLERRYGSYTSHVYQNDYIQIFGEQIRKDIAVNVINAEFFTILADETKDISRKEQLCVILRYFDPNNKIIKERAIGTYHMQVLTAEALSQFIYEEVKNLGIN